MDLVKYVFIVVGMLIVILIGDINTMSSRPMSPMYMFGERIKKVNIKELKPAFSHAMKFVDTPKLFLNATLT